ncbi:MAG: amino acid ABC transporter permease [Microcoleaceae cyanobacterium]
MNPQQKVPLWRDDRFWKVIIQVIVVVAVIAFVSLLINTLPLNLKKTGGTLSNFGFLDSTAGFSISESLIPYSPTDPYARVLLAGLLNSLRVIVAGIILTTLLGSAAGIAYFSDNWLLRKISVVYVEIVRNTPLLLQLLFWYGIFLQLPALDQKVGVFNSIFLSRRGIYVPWPKSPIIWVWLGVLLAGVVAAFFVGRWRINAIVEQGQSGQTQQKILWGMGILGLLIVIFGFGWNFPQATEEGVRGVTGGLRLTIELAALLVGLVVYTGAYIAEIVRSGIQSVPKGQWEAARSLGLRSGEVMQLVVFPQALRVIIPPLNSQYMNLAKNSSLAIAVAYPDIYNVANTTFNQSGQVVEVMLIIMATYLGINLLISLCMNLLNRSVQLKER